MTDLSDQILAKLEAWKRAEKANDPNAARLFREYWALCEKEMEEKQKEANA